MAVQGAPGIHPPVLGYENVPLCPAFLYGFRSSTLGPCVCKARTLLTADVGGPSDHVLLS